LKGFFVRRGSRRAYYLLLIICALGFISGCISKAVTENPPLKIELQSHRGQCRSGWVTLNVTSQTIFNWTIFPWTSAVEVTFRVTQPERLVGGGFGGSIFNGGFSVTALLMHPEIKPSAQIISRR